MNNRALRLAAASILVSLITSGVAFVALESGQGVVLATPTMCCG